MKTILQFRSFNVFGLIITTKKLIYEKGKVDVYLDGDDIINILKEVKRKNIDKTERL